MWKKIFQKENPTQAEEAWVGRPAGCQAARQAARCNSSSPSRGPLTTRSDISSSVRGPLTTRSDSSSSQRGPLTNRSDILRVVTTALVIAVLLSASLLILLDALESFFKLREQRSLRFHGTLVGHSHGRNRRQHTHADRHESQSLRISASTNWMPFGEGGLQMLSAIQRSVFLLQRQWSAVARRLQP